MPTQSGHPNFDYGDTVRVVSGEHQGRLASVVGINDSKAPRTYTVEFGDGIDCELPEHFLSKHDVAPV